MLRFTAIALGLIFITLGVMGFIPEFNKDGRLFGIFAMTSFSNILHLVTGFLAILSGIKSSYAAKIFFIAVGLAYLALAAMGFYHDSGELLRYIASTSTDNWLNSTIALLFLYVGITFAKK